MEERIIYPDGNHFVLICPYDKILIEKIKGIPGRDWDMKKRYWKVPASSRIELERFAYHNSFKFQSQRMEQEVWQVAPMPELEFQIPLKMEMYPYQKQGVAYTLLRKRAILGDKPGLGKTVQAIASCIGLEQTGTPAFPCLVICPSGLKENWRREWSIKWSDKKAIILQDSIKNNFPRYWESGLADVFIVNYESLKKYFVKSMPKLEKGDRYSVKDIEFKDELRFLFKSIIVDESHRCSSFQTLQTKLVYGLAQGKDVRLLCTGTPVINKPVDIVPQLGIIDRLDDFGGYEKFLDRYCSGKMKASNLQELNSRLRHFCFYQREKSDVLKDLPDKTRQIVYCEIANRKEYQVAEVDFKKYLKEYQKASDEKLRASIRGQILVQMSALKAICARGKMKDVVEYVHDTINSGEKMVLFGYLKETINTIKSHFPDCVTVTGSDNEKQKQHSVDKFQTDPECMLLAANFKSGGVGYTMTAASIVGFIELWWNSVVHDQAEDRCHRIGQKDSVNSIWFLGRKTIDEKIYKIIDTKRKMAAAVTGSTEVVEESIIDDLINLFNQEDAA